MEKSKLKPIFAGPSLGVSFLGFLVLLVLKMTSLVDISWIWVTCPLWIGPAICFSLWLWCVLCHILVKTICYVPVIVVPVSVDDGKDEDAEDC